MTAVQPPSVDPAERAEDDVAPANSYHPKDRVWVHRQGQWEPGVIQTPGKAAVAVDIPHGRGVGTETFWPAFVMPREVHVPEIDELVG